MVKLSCRSLLRKSRNEKGLQSIALYVQKLEIGDKVVVTPCKDLKRGIPNRRFVGKIGVVKSCFRNTNSYLVLFEKKKIVTAKAHLKLVT